MVRTAFLALIAAAAVAADTAPAGAAAIAVVQRAGKPALHVTLPAGWTAIAQGDATILKSPTGAPHVELRPTAEASLIDGMRDVAKVYAEYVTGFSTREKAKAQVAGGDAWVLSGQGAEADDGDPSNAEITLFSVDGVVWALTAHGEGAGVMKAKGDLDALRAGIVAAK